MSPEATSFDTTTRVCTLSVVSHGQGHLVERLLADLATAPDAPVAEVFVTLNLPGDPIQVADGFPFRVRFIENAAPRGFGANHNAALALCATPWFGVLNPDLRLREDPLAPMLAEARPDVGLLCPRVLESNGSEADSARELPTPPRLVRRTLRRLTGGQAQSAREDAETGADWYAGMFLLIRTTALRAIGGFDERYFMYCEDVDLCARLRLNGWRLHAVRGAAVVHEAQRASTRSLQYLGWHLGSLARLWSSRVFWRYREMLFAERNSAPHKRAASRG